MIAKLEPSFRDDLYKMRCVDQYCCIITDIATPYDLFSYNGIVMDVSMYISI